MKIVRAERPGNLFRRAVEALNLPNDDLCATLKVGNRTVRRWIAGSAPAPQGVILEMRDLVADRVEELCEIERELKVAATKPNHLG